MGKDTAVKIYGKFRYLLYAIALIAVSLYFIRWSLQSDEIPILVILIMLVPPCFALKYILIFLRRVIIYDDRLVLCYLITKQTFLYDVCEFELRHYVKRARGAVQTGGFYMIGATMALGSMEEELHELTIITDKENCRGVKISSKHFRGFMKKIDMNKFKNRRK